MANYKVVDADLASVADSIRAKAGTADQMAFPDGFKSAVEGIQTGGAVELPNAEDATFGTGSGSDITEYKVQRSTMDGLADEARRISGSENELSTAEMLDTFGNAVAVKNQDITITESGVYTAADGYTGLGVVTVEVAGVPANAKLYYVGAAASTWDLLVLSAESSAVGVLTE